MSIRASIAYGEKYHLFKEELLSEIPRFVYLELESPSGAYSGERERPFWLNVNTLFLNASPTEVCTPGVHVQSIS